LSFAGLFAGIVNFLREVFRAFPSETDRSDWSDWSDWSDKSDILDSTSLYFGHTLPSFGQHCATFWTHATLILDMVYPSRIREYKSDKSDLSDQSAIPPRFPHSRETPAPLNGFHNLGGLGRGRQRAATAKPFWTYPSRFWTSLSQSSQYLFPGPRPKPIGPIGPIPRLFRPGSFWTRRTRHLTLTMPIPAHPAGRGWTGSAPDCNRTTDLPISGRL